MIVNKDMADKWLPTDTTKEAEVAPPVETDDAEIPETLAEAVEAKKETPKTEEKPKVAEAEKKTVGRPKKKVEEPLVEEVEVAAEEKEVEITAEMQALIDEYGSEEAAEAAVEAEKDELSPELKQEYEYLKEVVSDPFVSSYLEWKKAGGSNPKDFIKELGITGVERGIEDYVRVEAISLGLEGDDLEEAIASEIDRYNDLSVIQQRKRLKEYKDADVSSLDEKIKSFSGEQSAKAKQMQIVQQSASEQLTQEVEKLKGKTYKGLLIDEPMAKQIQKDAPLFSTAILDEKGALVRFDVEKGIRAAIYLNYEKKILKETYNLGRTAAAKEFALKRHRPNADTLSASNTAAPTADEELAVATKALFKKSGGLGN